MNKFLKKYKALFKLYTSHLSSPGIILAETTLCTISVSQITTLQKTKKTLAGSHESSPTTDDSTHLQVEQELNGGGPCTALRIGFEGLATLYHVEAETHDLEGVHDPTKN